MRNVSRITEPPKDDMTYVVGEVHKVMRLVGNCLRAAENHWDRLPPEVQNCLNELFTDDHGAGWHISKGVDAARLGKAEIKRAFVKDGINAEHVRKTIRRRR